MLAKLTPSPFPAGAPALRLVASGDTRASRRAASSRPSSATTDHAPASDAKDDCPCQRCLHRIWLSHFLSDRAQAIRTMKPLPEARDPIPVECFVDAHDGEAAFDGLGSEQPIKWVAMVKRQRSDARDVTDLDWE